MAGYQPLERADEFPAVMNEVGKVEWLVLFAGRPSIATNGVLVTYWPDPTSLLIKFPGLKEQRIRSWNVGNPTIDLESGIFEVSSHLRDYTTNDLNAALKEFDDVLESLPTYK